MQMDLDKAPPCAKSELTEELAKMRKEEEGGRKRKRSGYIPSVVDEKADPNQRDGEWSKEALRPSPPRRSLLS